MHRLLVKVVAVAELVEGLLLGQVQEKEKEAGPVLVHSETRLLQPAKF